MTATCSSCWSTLTLFAKDNPFEIWKCKYCGLILFDRTTGKETFGKIKEERFITSNVIEGIFESNDGKITEKYFRVPNGVQSFFTVFEAWGDSE